MIGEIKKVDERWYISRCVGDGVREVWEELTPLHPIDSDKLTDSMDGLEVEFEIVNEFSHPHLYTKIGWGEGLEYALIIDKQEYPVEGVYGRPSWDEIYESYKGVSDLHDFVEWLKENYYTPIKKQK